MAQNLSSRFIQPTANSSHSLSWPWNFVLSLSKLQLTLPYVVRGLVKLMLRQWTNAAHALLPPRDARQGRENARESRTFCTPIAITSLSSTWLIADKLFVEVFAEVSQQPSTTLDQTVILKRKRQCKIWRFSWPKPIVSFYKLLQITPDAKTNYVIIRLVCPRTIKAVNPISAVCVLCKPHSYKRFLLRPIYRGLFSLV